VNAARGPASSLSRLVLAGVGILVFVDQQIAQAVLPLVAHFRMFSKSATGNAIRSSKVDRLIGRSVAE
jgi:hypothetical protein